MTVRPQEFLDLAGDAASVRERAEELVARLDRGPGAMEAQTAVSRLEEAELWLERGATRYQETHARIEADSLRAQEQAGR